VELAVPEGKVVSPKKVFTRIFGLNWQIGYLNNYRFARIYSKWGDDPLPASYVNHVMMIDDLGINV